MKVIIVDDEKPALDELFYLLSQYQTVDILARFINPQKALEYLMLHDVDVVFTDISMPEMDGFVLAEALLRLKKVPLIVFITAYDEYAIKAFKVNAIDYLLKPITEDRLAHTISRLEANMSMKNQEQHQQEELNNLLKERYINKKATRIPLWKNDRIYLISPSDIIYAACLEGETKIVTQKDTFVSSEPLTHFEEILSEYNFFRCHRSYLIHLDDIAEIIPWFNATYVVKLTNSDEEIPVSRRNVKEFKQRLSL